MEEAKKTGHPYQLVLTIVNRGSSDQVMEAARSAGPGAARLFMPAVWAMRTYRICWASPCSREKEIVAILVPTGPKAAGDAGHQPGGRPEN